jgi:hypothetical protein
MDERQIETRNETMLGTVLNRRGTMFLKTETINIGARAKVRNYQFLISYERTRNNELWGRIMFLLNEPVR